MHSSKDEPHKYSPAIRTGSHPWALYWVWLTIFVGSFIPSAPWLSQNSILFGMIATGMLIAPSRTKLPKTWVFLAALFLLFSASSFLPSEWFHIPAWRIKLESLGVNTGSQVAIQWQQALENYGYLALMVFSGSWVVAHRPSSRQLRNITLLFTCGVAIYALLSILMKGEIPANKLTSGHFGFFPNRNHTGTYLAIGAVCGFGVILQGLRDRHYARMVTATLAVIIIVWAIFGWSISRAGIVLLAAGFILWLLVLGFKYLGKQEIKALCLLALLGAGSFAVSETRVKSRLSETTEKITTASQVPAANEESPNDASAWDQVDFRVPAMLDTLVMLKEAPLTGVGGGQFTYVFPQYRDRTAGLNHAQLLHPESDWLWLAAEYGIPAAVALLTVILVVTFYAWSHIRKERDRALRGACLVTGLLIVIHGFFDVPGHRLPLALAAMLFFALCLPAYDLTKKSAQRGINLIPALLVMLGAMRLGWIIWHPQSPPAITIGNITYEASKILYLKNSHPTESDTFIDLLNRAEQGDKMITAALENAPLDARLYRVKGCLLLPFSQQTEKLDRAFAIERLLTPSRINTPLQQGNAIAPYSPPKAVTLWKVALAQSAELEKKHSDQISRKRTENQLLFITRSSKPLRKLAEEAINP